MTIRENNQFMNNLRKSGVRQQLTLDRLAMELDRALARLRAGDTAPKAEPSSAAGQGLPAQHM